MLRNPKPKIGAVLLAAGKASRMGRPKQLLVYDGCTLIEHALNKILNSRYIQQTSVVLGAYTEQILPVISSYPVITSLNAYWETGMASSIKTGLEALLLEEPALDALFICLVDQPYLTSALIDTFANRFIQEQEHLIVARYENGVKGVPALFDKQLFKALLAMNGEIGARHLIKNNLHLAGVIDFPKGTNDLDTPEDWQKFLTSLNN